jgi:ubiquinone/menaquinone biosynthesis C-methylase UbiE
MRGGPSSFALHDPRVVFRSLGLKKGDAFLDLGCGPGEYSLWAAEVVGSTGSVLAIDINARFINGLIAEARIRGLTHLTGRTADLRLDPILATDRSIDVCLLAAVLHLFDLHGEVGDLLREVRRVLRSGGRLGILNCKKEPQPYGPPLHVRQSPDEVEAAAEMCGYRRSCYRDLGGNYLLVFDAI